MATRSSILAWKNRMGRGVWRGTAHGAAENRTGLSEHTRTVQIDPAADSSLTPITEAGPNSACISCSRGFARPAPSVSKTFHALSCWKYLHSFLVSAQIPLPILHVNTCLHLPVTVIVSL